MVFLIALVFLEGFCALWLLQVFRSHNKGEAPIALGFAMFVYQCFHVFGRFPPPVQGVDPPVALKAFCLAVLVGSVLVIAWSLRLLKTEGRAARGWEGSTVLIERGPFNIVRHPIYGAVAVAAVAVALYRITPFGIIYGAIAVGLFGWGARLEDRANLARFGSAYDAYRKRTRLMIPFVI